MRPLKGMITKITCERSHSINERNKVEDNKIESRNNLENERYTTMVSIMNETELDLRSFPPQRRRTGLIDLLDGRDRAKLRPYIYRKIMAHALRHNSQMCMTNTFEQPALFVVCPT
jgi:hypothetical protein